MFEEVFAVYLHDALVVWFEIFFFSHYWLQHVVAENVLVPEVEVDVVDWRDLEFWKYFLLWFFWLFESWKSCHWLVLNDVEDGLSVIVVVVRASRYIFTWIAAFAGNRVSVLYFIEGDIIIFLNEGVESIFYFIFWSSLDMFADFWPLASHLAVKLEYFSIFSLTPIFFFYFRV